MKIMSSIVWNSAILDFIDSNICGKGQWLHPKITQTTSVFSSNCFNCLSWENLPDADYWRLTLCENPQSSTCWLRNSSWTPSCESFSQFINTDHLK